MLDGTASIDPFAFAQHASIEAVQLPSTLRMIGEHAFKGCKKLRHVNVPDSVETIEEEAFFDTQIEEFRVPPRLRELGRRALVTYGAHSGKGAPSLTHIEVSPENSSFYLASGMLCRKSKRGASVVIYAGEEPSVEFPEEILNVEDYAFSNARGIEYLSLNPRLSGIGANGMYTRCWIRHIHIDLANPIENRRSFDFFFPNTPGGIRGISLGLGGANWVNVPNIAEQLDISLASAHEYNSTRGSGGISAYEQAKLILARLADPVLLTRANRSSLEEVLKAHIVEICVDVALHDDREVLDDLLDQGFVNAENLNEVIERVTALRDAATSAHLLEAKRLRFSQSAFDYDL